MLEPRGALPQPAWRVDNDFTRLFEGEVLLAVETLNIDAASFTQMEKEGGPGRAHRHYGRSAERGKQHNPVTGSGGMLLGRVLQIAPAGRPAARRWPVGRPGGDARLALAHAASHRPRASAVRPASAQMDVEGEAVLFASGAYAKLPADLPERLALAALDVAGAAPQVARLVKPGGGRGRARRRRQERHPLRGRGAARGGPGACIVGLEASPRAADELRALGLCDAVVAADARDPVAVRRAVLGATGGREADVAFSCVNVPDAELGAILATRDRGVVYFFAMSTSFTQGGARRRGRGQGRRPLHRQRLRRTATPTHTLAMLRDMPAVRALFERATADRGYRAWRRRRRTRAGGSLFRRTVASLGVGVTSASSAAGSTMVNVVPAPGCECTSMVPPAFWTMLWLMARPEAGALASSS